MALFMPEVKRILYSQVDVHCPQLCDISDSYDIADSVKDT